MSTGVSGIIYMGKKEESYEIDTSFYLEKLANKYRIGSKFGGNVSEEVYRNYSDETEGGEMVFEIMDSPLDTYAEQLFEPDTYGEYETESLYSRMERVQSMLEEIVIYKNIDKIIVDLNYLFGFKEKEICVKVSDFAEVVSSLYKENEVFVPIMRVIIRK